MWTTKGCGLENKRLLGLAYVANQNYKKKNNKQAELMGLAHMDTELDRVDSNQ